MALLDVPAILSGLAVIAIAGAAAQGARVARRQRRVREPAAAIVSKGPHFHRFDMIGGHRDDEPEDVANLESNWWITDLLRDRPVQLVACYLRPKGSRDRIPGSLMLQDWLDSRELGPYPKALVINDTAHVVACFYVPWRGRYEGSALVGDITFVDNYANEYVERRVRFHSR